MEYIQIRSTEFENTSVDILSEETILSISKLEKILRKIDARMQNEGYIIKEGKIQKREKDN